MNCFKFLWSEERSVYRIYEKTYGVRRGVEIRGDCVSYG